jgi:hypothetical protein
VLRLLLSPADVARCAATCRTVRAAVRTASLALALSLPLQLLSAAAPPPLLPSGLLARGWLHVSRLELSGAFLAEEEVIAALSLPHLRHLSLLGCQKVTGEPPLLAALLAAPALASFAVQSCFSLRAASACALLAACLDGRCALQSLGLGSAALDFGSLLPGGEAAEPPGRSRLRLLALPSCELSGMRHAPAALGRAPLGAPRAAARRRPPRQRPHPARPPQPPQPPPPPPPPPRRRCAAPWQRRRQPAPATAWPTR